MEFEPYCCFNKGLDSRPHLCLGLWGTSKVRHAAKLSNGFLYGSVFTEVDEL